VVDELPEVGEPGGDGVRATRGGVGLVGWGGHRLSEFLIQCRISQLPHGAQPGEPEHPHLGASDRLRAGRSLRVVESPQAFTDDVVAVPDMSLHGGSFPRVGPAHG
jgi:hypothetical protein